MKTRRKTRKTKTGSMRVRTGGVIAALAASAAVFIAMLQMEKNILTRYERGTVFAAAVEIPRGQLITEDNINYYFKELQLDKSCIPPTALTDAGQAAGLAACFDIEEVTILTTGMFTQMNMILAKMDRPVVAGFKADDIYQVAGGVLRTGDRINIYSVGGDGEGPVWRDIFVHQVFDASGTVIPNADTVTAAARVNVFLDEGDVEEFYALLDEGSLRVVKLLK